MDSLGALKELIIADSTSRRGQSNAMQVVAPQRLRPKHRQVIMLTELGYSQAEIASMVGYTQARISVIQNWHGHEVDEFRQQARQQVIDRTLNVADKIAVAASGMVDVMLFHANRKVEDPTNSRLAARDLLHMAGYSPVKKTINANLNAPPPREIVDALAMIGKTQEVEEKEHQWAVKEPPKLLKDGTNG